MKAVVVDLEETALAWQGLGEHILATSNTHRPHKNTASNSSSMAANIRFAGGTCLPSRYCFARSEK
jgi:hypothetical protein